MKRFLLLFCSVVICCALFVVPAFASETDTYTINFTNGSSWDGPAITEGYYTAILYIDGDDNPIVFDTPFFVKSDGACYRINSFEYDNVTWTPQFCVMEDLTTFDISDSTGLFLEKNGRIEFIPAVIPDEPVKPVEPVSPLSGVFGIFTGISGWIIGQLGQVQGIFWNADAGSLTFLGVLSVSALALAVVLLLVMVVVRFLRFRS